VVIFSWGSNFWVSALEEKNKTVLIIDDDESIARTFARILEKRGYIADSALTGKEAIQKAAQKPYTVALIDICLPDMSGTDLIDKLGNNEKMIKIIITGFPSMTSKTKADAYLVKPVRPQELIDLIEWKLSTKVRSVDP
jgi:DNA-binding response OmpR family regulator